jgi:hypothetical protein
LRLAAARAFDSWTDAARKHLRAAGVPRATADELATLFVALVEGTFTVSRTQRSIAPLLAAGKHARALTHQAIERGRTTTPTRARRTASAAR